VLLLLASGGVAGGALAAYLDANHAASPPASVATSGVASNRQGVTTGGSSEPASTSAEPRTHRASRTHRVRRPTAATVATGHSLNDQGYALIQRLQYAPAVPLLERAVRALRGTGPADPYEGFANYNLGYALLRTGRCNAAVVPLQRAARLESSPLVQRALTEAEACSPGGS
jgi:hypothetical protein